MFRFITDRSLAFKMSFYLLIFTILIFIIVLYFNYKKSQEIVIENLKDYTSEIKKATVNSINEVFYKNQSFGQSFKELLEGTSLTKNELYKFMYDAVQSNEYVYGCQVMFEPYAFDKDTMRYAPLFYNVDSALTRFGSSGFYTDYFSKKAYIEATKTGKDFWLEPYSDTINGKETLLTSYYLPFYYPQNKQKGARGVIAVDISLDWLIKYISEIKPFETGYLILISENGNIVSKQDEFFKRNDNIYELNDYKGMEYLKIVKGYDHKKDTNLEVQNSITGEKGRLFIWHIESSGWKIVMYVSEKELYRDFFTLLYYLISFSFIGILVLITITIIISKRFTRPIKNLAIITSEIGTGNFEIKLPEVKTKDEIGVLNSAINKMQKSLKQYVRNIEETTSARERMEGELQIARDIQMSIIPKKFPPFPKIKSFELYAHLEQAKQVGGDLYDFFMIDHDHLCIAIGDVSGKGVPAALFMAITRTLLRAKAALHYKPHEIIASMNKTISSENDNYMFVTFAVGVLDIFSGDFEYCSAGHNAPFIYKNKSDFELLKVNVNIPLGIDSEYFFKSNKFKFEDGDKLFLYTDGVTEAMDNNGNFFSDERLQVSLSSHKDNGVTEMTYLVKKDIHSFIQGAEQSDDMAMLMLSFRQSEYTTCIIESIKIENNLAKLDLMADFVKELGNQYLFSQKILFEINLVLEELLTNTIKYGYSDNNFHEIEIILYLCKEEIIVEIIDDSNEFNPFDRGVPEQLTKSAEDREIGGLGIFFVMNYADKYSYKRESGKNIIRLSKNINA
jgi:sigma-B regulation protein RsbU (phosphoserine phosphatase)